MSATREWIMLTVLDKDLAATKVIFKISDIDRIVENVLGSTVFVSEDFFGRDNKMFEVEETPDQIIKKLGPISLW